MSEKVYCKYCGKEAQNVKSLTQNTLICHQNPEGKYHVPYEGEEKSSYECKYCGKTAPSIKSLTQNTLICRQNPQGKHHVPL